MYLVFVLKKLITLKFLTSFNTLLLRYLRFQD